MSVSEAYNFVQIDDQTGTAGVIDREQLAQLGAEGYEVLINLLPRDSQYAVADEESIVRGQGLDYHHIPVDFARPGREDYVRFARTVEPLQGRRVMIHCAANYRVSAFYAIYACHHLGWSRERAMAHIESIWNPADHPPWAEFIEQNLPAGSG